MPSDTQGIGTIQDNSIYLLSVADSLGLSTVTSNMRGCEVRLKQTQAIDKSCAALFSHRRPSEWNKLPLAVTLSTQL